MGMTYAVSDLHGNYALFEKVKQHMNEDDHCYVLGDCIDRGPSGLDILLDIKNDDRFTLIVGNHEEMMVDVCESWNNYPEDDKYFFYNSDDMVKWSYNGGLETFKKWIRGKNYGLIRWMKQNMAYYRKYVNTNGNTIFLCHSGNTADTWDRDYIFDGLSNTNNIFCVHGHTPSMYIVANAERYGMKYELVNNSVIYADGYRICIDTGFTYEKASDGLYHVAMIDLDSFNINDISCDVIE